MFQEKDEEEGFAPMSAAWNGGKAIRPRRNMILLESGSTGVPDAESCSADTEALNVNTAATNATYQTGSEMGPECFVSLTYFFVLY